MALNKTQLAEGILVLMNDMRTRTEPSDDEFADRLSTLIDTFVRSGTVTIQPGIAVSTAGTAAAQTGTTTTNGTGTIN